MRAVIPTIVTQALARDVIELGATTTTRDFLFVADTAAGLRYVEDGHARGKVVITVT